MMCRKPLTILDKESSESVLSMTLFLTSEEAEELLVRPKELREDTTLMSTSLDVSDDVRSKSISFRLTDR